MTNRRRSDLPSHVAVVGSGVAGLTAAHVLSSHSSVTIVEADDRLGGHAHTHTVTMPDGASVGVDSGFIVHNDRTYPTLLRLFAELGVPTQDTDMSMSVSSAVTGLEYAGALGFSGLFPTARNAARWRYLRMLGEVTRFHRAARALLDTPGSDDALSDESLEDFLDRQNLSAYFREHFMLPLVAAVWSCDAATAGRYPARYLFTFLDHHGMLSVFGSPTWRTVVGGSNTYVQAVADGVRRRGGSVQVSAPVRHIRENPDGTVELTTAAGSQRFDAVVIATHPHQGLRLLDAPTAEQRRTLSAIKYAPKQAVLHSDVSLMPRARRAWASWNYQIHDDGSGSVDESQVAVTYDMTRLMRLRADHPRMLVTLGRTDLVDESTILAEMTYEHPVYTTESVAAQKHLPEIDTDSIVFAGAYHGWGFHEDGALSGARAAARLGVSWDAELPRPAVAERESA